jgi:hypothetical protein
MSVLQYLFLLFYLLKSAVASKYLQPTHIWDEISNVTTDAEFVEEMTKIASHASSLRDGNPYGYFVNYTAGYNGFVGRLCFEDDLCWATKISLQHTPYYTTGMKHAVRSLEAITSFCPNVPVPRVHGHSIDVENATFCYYFMDWIEGRTLIHNFSRIYTDLPQNRSIPGDYEANITISEGFIVQLASFVYNLTTCIIPEDQGMPESFFYC